jgi:hypothetical protein
LTLQLLDTFGVLGGGVNGSELRFDFAAVNETAIPPSPSPSSSLVPQSSSSLVPQSSSSLVPQSSYVSQFRFQRSNLNRLLSHKRLGLAIGGALGGTAALAIAALAGIYLRRRAHKGGAEDILDKQEQEQEQPVIAAGLRYDPFPVPPLGQGTKARASAMYQHHAERGVPLSTSPSFPPLHHETPTRPTSISHDDEELQLLGRMYNLNMPAAEIARVVDVMRSRRQTAQGAGSSAFTDGGPPSYGIGML